LRSLIALIQALSNIALLPFHHFVNSVTSTLVVEVAFASGDDVHAVSFCQARKQSLGSQFCLVLVEMNAIGVLNYRRRSLVF
jgi:hypothetical protein